jgi:galactokinase
VCPALDSLWAVTVAQPGVFGGRRAGGGFAGQVVALVAADRAETIAAAAAVDYRRKTNQQPGWCVAAVASDPVANA